MGFKDVFDKAKQKAEELKNSKPVADFVDKTVEYVTEPKTKKEHVKSGIANTAFGVALGAMTGGSLVLIPIAGAAAEELIQKKVSQTDWAKKKVAERAAKNKNEPKPE